MWCSHVEIHAGIGGACDRPLRLPDGDCLPPFETMSPDIAFREVVEGRWAGPGRFQPVRAASGTARSGERGPPM